MNLKTNIIALWLLMPPLAAAAQSDRITALQNARSLLISEGATGRVLQRTIESGGSQMLHISNGRLVSAGDTVEMRTASLRVTAMPRFAVDEDSTTFASAYSVEHGLLAFRRTMNVGQWNTLAVPFNLTGSQLRDAFGDDCQLLEYARAISEPSPALEFDAVDLATDDVVVRAGQHYLLKPTREPDIAAGRQTTVAYGSAKVAGPVYAIADVTMGSGQLIPRNTALRSEDNKVRLRLRGNYAAYTIPVNNTPRYALNDEGHFLQLEEQLLQKGFRSWLENASSDNSTALRFYISGIGEDLGDPTGIASVLLDTPASTTAYDLQGRPHPTATLQRGLYIVAGKKIIVR